MKIPKSNEKSAPVNTIRSCSNDHHQRPLLSYGTSIEQTGPHHNHHPQHHQQSQKQQQRQNQQHQNPQQQRQNQQNQNQQNQNQENEFEEEEW